MRSPIDKDMGPRNNLEKLRILGSAGREVAAPSAVCSSPLPYIRSSRPIIQEPNDVTRHIIGRKANGDVKQYLN